MNLNWRGHTFYLIQLNYFSYLAFKFHVFVGLKFNFKDTVNKLWCNVQFRRACWIHSMFVHRIRRRLLWFEGCYTNQIFIALYNSVWMETWAENFSLGCIYLVTPSPCIVGINRPACRFVCVWWYVFEPTSFLPFFGTLIHNILLFGGWCGVVLYCCLLAHSLDSLLSVDPQSCLHLTEGTNLLTIYNLIYFNCTRTTCGDITE